VPVIYFSIANLFPKIRHEPGNGGFQLEEIEDVLPNPFKDFAPWIGDENPSYEIKLQQATFAWSDLEPRQGGYNWARLEKDCSNVVVTRKRVGFRPTIKFSDLALKRKL
jgi:hypothetical protein